MTANPLFVPLVAQQPVTTALVRPSTVTALVSLGEPTVTFSTPTQTGVLDFSNPANSGLFAAVPL